MVLALGLPDMDGKAVILHIRQSSRLPVIVLSAREQEARCDAILDAPDIAA